MHRDDNKKISDTISNLLHKMGLEDIKIESRKNAEGTKTQKEEQLTIFNIQSQDSPLLIGRGGENLSSLQHIVYILTNRQMENVPKFMLDVNNYRQDQKNRVIDIAKYSIDRVKAEGRNEILRPMTSYERKIIHTIVSEHNNLESTSIGEEPNRRVLIRLKK